MRVMRGGAVAWQSRDGSESVKRWRLSDQKMTALGRESAVHCPRNKKPRTGRHGGCGPRSVSGAKARRGK